MDVVHSRVCSSAPARLEVLQSTLCRKREYCSSSVVFTPSATCLAEPTRPNIVGSTSDLWLWSYGITGSIVIGVNKENIIWCRARSWVEFKGWNQLSALFWQHSNGTRLPAFDRGQSSGYDVYMERYRGGQL